MVAHIIDTQVIETLGEINYNLLCELTELWLMKDYFARKNAFLAFCIMKPGSPSVRMTSWQGDLSDPMISGKIVNEAMSSYIEVPQKFHADQRGSSYIYYDIALIKDAKIIGTNHCFILRFEDYSVFAFAYNDTSIEPDIMRMVMFEYSYGVCRILAPQSNTALAMINNMYPYHDMEFETHKGYERRLIRHVEQAFCKKRLPSIEAWRKQ